MSQFHRLPGVNDEMIQMLEETKLQVYRRKKLMLGLMGEDMVGINLGEQVENAAEDADIEVREKCIPKKAKIFHSSYIERIVKVGDKLSKYESGICNSIFASNRDDGVIDCWAGFLNKMENYKDESSLSRFFFDTTIVTEEILKELKTEDLKCRLFATLLQIYIKKFDVKPSFRDVALILDDAKYYLLVFDLRSSSYYIVDHVKRTGILDRKYGMIPNLVKKLFCNYLTSQHHPMAKALCFKVGRVMNISWQVEQVGTDCGIYLMRHMESYMGGSEGRWECGLIDKKAGDLTVILKLRMKYMARLLTADFNKCKSIIVTDFEAFRKLDILEQTMILQQSAENRKKKRKTRGRH
ncbi:unnamed protein product [Lactuca saligna]|uniref:Ubiquitin-like protease family profile domain-containing protein n=1 Tax=Lactuca saligna TaxID=75948 RepID=A0AA35ZYF5_LACSI|nr:unnamed protein product [Lactuca saligna]